MSRLQGNCTCGLGRSAARSALLAALLLLGAGGGSRPVFAQPPVVSQLSADEAAEQVRAETRGRVLDVRLDRRGGRARWRVKVLLPGGRVRVFWVDANGGRR